MGPDMCFREDRAEFHPALPHCVELVLDVSQPWA